MKKIFTSLFLSVFASAAFSQQDAQFTQNMFNRLAINPGYAGANDAYCATVLGRNQWMGFGTGSPKTYLLSLDAAVPVLRGGFGLNVMQDVIGFENNSMVNAGYAYRMPLGPSGGMLGIGANVGFLSKSIRGNWKAIDGHLDDVAIPNQGVSDLVFDASFGVYYSLGNMYAGISTTHIPASSIEDTDLQFDLARHYYIMAGYSFQLPNDPNIELKPSVFVKTVGSNAQFDLNCNVVFQRMVWGGLTYRFQDAIAVMAGVQLPNNLKIGYAYDLTTSRMGSAGVGGRRVNTHEIMLGYCFTITPRPKISIHRNTRIL